MQVVKKFVRYLKYMRSMERINMALNRAAATSALRRVDPTDPRSWEFSGFSQNGEDGIIDYLTRRLKNPNRYFIEIGSADGVENNTAWLAVARRYAGLMTEGDTELSAWCRYWMTPFNWGVESINLFVTKDNVTDFKQLAVRHDPDVFSLDIDGNDYHIVEALLESGLRPKICIVEYNSAFGPDKCVSVKYKEDFRVVQEHRLSLYFGCSIGAWKRLFSMFGYRFVTVDSNGVNAFFIDPKEFDCEFVDHIRGVEFRENMAQLREYKAPWEKRFELIRDMDLVQTA